MNNWTNAIAAPLIALILAVSPVRADQHLAASTEFVQNLADRAITTLTADGQTAEMRQPQFRDLFREGFAIKGIARYVLGRNWSSASKSDRTEYLTLFEEVIVTTWADRFSDYSGEKFTVENAVDASSANSSEHVAIIRSIFLGIISQSAEGPKRPGLPPSTSAERLKGAPCLASRWHRHESDVVALYVNPQIWDNGIDIREEI